MERISAVLPALAASAERAKDAIEPVLRKGRYDLGDYDRQVQYILVHQYLYSIYFTIFVFLSLSSLFYPAIQSSSFSRVLFPFVDLNSFLSIY